ncbi:hypothetical protein CsSME_00002750 [Camellia sinensis var. sinensis]
MSNSYDSKYMTNLGQCVPIMEAFSRLLSRAVHEGLLSGFTVGSPMGSAIRVSHLLYADDALVFCDAEVAQLGFL